MDLWHFLDVTHADHVFCNPLSEMKVRQLGDALDLEPGTRVLDIACGPGELLIRWALQHGIAGVGVDVSPHAIRRAEARKAERAPDADLRFMLGRGEELKPEELGRFPVVTLVGASWIWSGFRGTLAAMLGFVEPGGLLVIGEPHWKKEPAPEYLHAEGLKHRSFLRLGEDAEAARALGLRLVTMVGSSLDDWDRYEMLQALAMDRFARASPDHPDLAEMQARVERSRDAYLRWGRDTVGFATFAFRAPAAPQAEAKPGDAAPAAAS